MELKDLIEQGNSKAGNQTALANLLGIPRDVLTHAKAGRRSLPVSACFKLAEILDIDERSVVATSELVTEKNPERRAVFAPFVMESANDSINTVKQTVKTMA